MELDTVTIGSYVLLEDEEYSEEMKVQVVEGNKGKSFDTRWGKPGFQNALSKWKTDYDHISFYNAGPTIKANSISVNHCHKK